MAQAQGRRLLVAAFVAAVFAGIAALTLPTWWKSRTGRDVAAPGTPPTVLPGNVTSARSKIDPGRPEKAILEAIGKPSVAVETKGAERHTIWTYYYADGNLTLNMTDGYLVRVDTEYGETRRGRPRE